REFDLDGLGELLYSRFVGDAFAEALVVHSLVGGVLVDEDQSIGRFARDVGVVQLTEHPERRQSFEFWPVRHALAGQRGLFVPAGEFSISALARFGRWAIPAVVHTVHRGVRRGGGPAPIVSAVTVATITASAVVAGLGRVIGRRAVWFVRPGRFAHGVHTTVIGRIGGSIGLSFVRRSVGS